MAGKKLSFIAPCYNGESYIARFLDSILSQTHEEIQLVLINDGSTDETEKILCSYEDAFSQRGIEYVHINQENKGIGGALNDALKYVTGDYLTWFGTDDYALPTYAEELVGFLESNREFAVVRNDGFIVDKNDLNKIIGKMADSNHDKHNPHLFENAIMERNFHFGYSVVRMSVFDEVNPTREIYPSREGQNWQLLLPVLYANKSAFYEKPLYYVVYDLESVSRIAHKSYDRIKKQNEEYERILNNVLAGMDIPDKERYLDMVRLKYIRRRMRAALDYGCRNDALAEYKKLRVETKPTFADKKHYIRAAIPFLNSILLRLKK